MVDDSKVAKDACDITVLDQSETKLIMNNNLDCEEILRNFRALNDVSPFDSEPMPSLEGALGPFVGDCVFSEIDLCKGHWQAPLSERAKVCIAFVSNRGLMWFKNCQCNVYTFKRKVLYGLNNIDYYFDNTVVHCKNWSDHLLALERLSERLHK